MATSINKAEQASRDKTDNIRDAMEITDGTEDERQTFWWNYYTQNRMLAVRQVQIQAETVVELMAEKTLATRPKEWLQRDIDRADVIEQLMLKEYPGETREKLREAKKDKLLRATAKS